VAIDDHLACVHVGQHTVEYLVALAAVNLRAENPEIIFRNLAGAGMSILINYVQIPTLFRCFFLLSEGITILKLYFICRVGV
jgi:hypothetical protein